MTRTRETVWRRYWPLIVIAFPVGFVVGGIYGLVTVGVANSAQLVPTFVGFGFGGMLFAIPGVLGAFLAVLAGDRWLRRSLSVRVVCAALGAFLGVTLALLVLDIVLAVQHEGQDFSIGTILFVVMPVAGVPAAVVAGGAVIAWEWRRKPRETRP
ncbi:hypothetical protein D9V32_08735 [Mycetocola tolaasinivorans]|uniref:Uncharacterized protein n=1 Tax=Mycetocola tolaasinivorans TaxID=76635 RepID=A0A3L7A5E9_9MICO|nr:hypothetical protein [Mycetocola tolaasinivorans]RLP75553.1 hypothetical protein D9V32_08735 [Mycetocola tolaasinivorans]